MTAQRKSAVFALELGFGTGVPDMKGMGYLEQPSEDTQCKYCQFPPGTFISHTGARQAQSVYTTGSKRRAGAVYGSFSGTWNISFPFDYNYLEPLTMIFENVDDNDIASDPFDGVFGVLDKPVFQNTTLNKPEHSTLRYFTKINDKRVKSFIIREKILNYPAGGDYYSDEVTILKGCVAKSFNVTRSASGSQMNIEISGVYADQETKLGHLQYTDYDMAQTMDGIAQYSCMFVDGINDDNYVGDVDSHSFSIDNNANLVFNTCTPIAKQYYEGQTNVSWNAQTYSNDPQRKFKLRPNSGGKDSTHMQPMGKGLAPMSYATWATYTYSIRDDGEPDGTYITLPAGVTRSYVAAIQRSDCSFVACAKNSTVKSMTWQKGDGSKMMDSLSSVECDEVRLRIVNQDTWVDTDKDGEIDDGEWFNRLWKEEHMNISVDPETPQSSTQP